MDNIIRFKDKRKLEKVLKDLNQCTIFVDMIIEQMKPHKIYHPIGDLLFQAHDSKALLSIHIKQITKELERND